MAGISENGEDAQAVTAAAANTTDVGNGEPKPNSDSVTTGAQETSDTPKKRETRKERQARIRLEKLIGKKSKPKNRNRERTKNKQKPIKKLRGVKAKKGGARGDFYTESFRLWTRPLNNQVNGEVLLTEHSETELDVVLRKLFFKFSEEAAAIMKDEGKKMLGDKHFEAAIRKLLTDPRAEKLIGKAKEAVEKSEEHDKALADDS